MKLDLFLIYTVCDNVMTLTKQDWLQAAKNGQLEKLQILRSLGCPEHKNASYMASVNGHWAVVKWLHITGKCYANGMTFIHAVKFGNLDMIRWLYYKRCQWNEDALVIAILNGNHTLVSWMVKHNCPICEKAINAVVNIGDVHLLKLLLDHGASKSPKATLIAVRNNDNTMLKYLDRFNFQFTEEVLDACQTEEMRIWVQHRLNEQELIFHLEINTYPLRASIKV